MTATTHGPCVCVQNCQRKSRAGQERKQESPDGGVCENSHTVFSAISAELLLLVGAKLHTQTHTERAVCVQSVYTLSGGEDV